MKLKRVFILVLLLFLFICGCDLKRNNPVDPENTGVPSPPIVGFAEPTFSNFSSEGINIIKVNWIALTAKTSDGYYIYRSRSYNGTYVRIADIDNVEQTSYEDLDNINEGQYFYKISAYVYVDESHDSDMRLEGPINPADGGVGTYFQAK